MISDIEVYKLNKEATLPTRHHSLDAGIDIYSLENCFIGVGETKTISTGIGMKVPDGFVGKIEDRSSMALKGLRTGAGVVDSGYSGELSIILHNISCVADVADSLALGYRINKGDKIAQMLVYRIELPNIKEVDTLWNSKRGNKGLGSSGR